MEDLTYDDWKEDGVACRRCGKPVEGLILKTNGASSTHLSLTGCCGPTNVFYAWKEKSSLPSFDESKELAWINQLYCRRTESVSNALPMQPTTRLCNCPISSLMVSGCRCGGK